MRKPVVVATLAVCLATQAQAGCWTKAEVDAARVRDLDTMLMVSALRCRQADPGFVARYNAFVKGSKPGLVAANAVLRARFAKMGASAFDNYVTRVANRYGTGLDALACRDMASLVATAALAGKTLQRLNAVAQRAALEPLTDGGQCGFIAAPTYVATVIDAPTGVVPMRAPVPATAPLVYAANQPSRRAATTSSARLNYDIKDSLYLR